MNTNNKKKQVSLAGAAGTTKKRKKRPIGKIIGVIFLLAFFLTVGILGYQIMGREKGPSLTAEEMVEYTVTPDKIKDKVSYFALGVVGLNKTECLDMVAVMCYNRQTKDVSVIQIPVSTYIGKDNGFATTLFGEVWGKPQPEVFCSVCRVRVYADQVQEDKHTVCGNKLENKTGSSFGDLIRVFNDQYGLPIDNYLVITRNGLVKLVDELGGLDLTLSAKATLNGKNFDAGDHTLTGTQAVEYAVSYNYKNNPKTDLERMGRQRAFFAALWQRLSACEMEDLYYVDRNTGSTKGMIGRLMNGSDPIRFNTTSFGKARLLSISDTAANKLKLSDAMAQFIYRITRTPLNQVSFSVLPGESVKSGTTTVYSVNKAKVIELLNRVMNPFGLALDETTVKAPQLQDTPSDNDATTVTLDTAAPSQSGFISTTTTTTTTATTETTTTTTAITTATETE